MKALFAIKKKGNQDFKQLILFLTLFVYTAKLCRFALNACSIICYPEFFDKIVNKREYVLSQGYQGHK